MNKLPVSLLTAVAALLASAAPALAQKGKGNGKGGAPPTPGKVLPFGHGKADPARPFEHPNTGNALPKATLDKLPPGLRDDPVNHPGVATHLRKLGDDNPYTDLLNQSSPLPLSPNRPARLFAQPKSGNSLSPEIRDLLPPGLRDMPESQPGLANLLRQVGAPLSAPAIGPGALIPPPSAPAPILPQPVRPLRPLFRGR